MKHYVVSKSIRIKAKPEKVWQALTDPEKTKKYFFNCRVFSDWEIGSPIVFKGKMFFVLPIEMKGKIVKIEPGHILKYTLKNGKSHDRAEGYSTVTDVLTYENGQTIVSINDDVGAGGNAQKRFERSQHGWDKILTGLKKTVEEGEA